MKKQRKGILTIKQLESAEGPCCTELTIEGAPCVLLFGRSGPAVLASAVVVAASINVHDHGHFIAEGPSGRPLRRTRQHFWAFLGTGWPGPERAHQIAEALRSMMRAVPNIAEWFAAGLQHANRSLFSDVLYELRGERP